MEIIVSDGKLLGIRAAKEDTANVILLEDETPTIVLKNKTDGEKVTICFEDKDTFEYVALKMNRFLNLKRVPKVHERLDTIRMKAILIDKQMNKTLGR